MSTILRDLKFALRQMLRSPVLTTLTVLILALGIGATTAIFSMVYGVILSPLPYRDAERLVVVSQHLSQAGVDDLGFSVPEYLDFRDQNRTFEGLVEYHTMPFTMLGTQEPQRVQTGVVSANFFDVLGTNPVVGRSFEAKDAQHGAEPVLILSHGYWTREFGGDPSVVGQSFELNDKTHTVIGILPLVPQYPNENDIYMPVSACPFRGHPDFEQNRKERILTVFGRLKEGVSLAEADADVKLIAGRLLADHPEFYGQGEGYDARVVALRETLLGDARATFAVLLATVALVLLITCVNLANLTFARLIRREKEMAVRTAMGADRGNLVRQLLTESLLLALVGGGLGIVLAYASLDLLVALASRFTARAGEISIDVTVLSFALFLSLVTGLVFGLIPAMSTSGRVVSALREGAGRSTASLAMKRFRNAFMVGELAITFALLMAAGLMVRSFWKLQAVDAGVDSGNVLTAQVSLNWSRYSTGAERSAFYDLAVDKVRSLPGVVSASLGRSLPFNQGRALINSDFEIEGGILAPDQPRPRADFQLVGEGFFATIGVPLVAGRVFTDADRPGRESVAVVNSSTARRYWGDRDPVGKRISSDGGSTWTTIVGVVGDVRQRGLDGEVTDIVYLSYFQFPIGDPNLLVRTAGDPRQLVGPLREAVYSIDPQQPVTRVQTLDEIRRRSVASPRLTTMLLSLFAGLALVIATAGLSGGVAYMVAQQTREIGVRIALGAGRSRVLWAILRGTLVLVGLGLALGLVGSLGAARMVSGLLFGIEPYDLPTFVAVGVLLAAITGGASVLAARRAVLVDPVEALRCE